MSEKYYPPWEWLKKPDDPSVIRNTKQINERLQQNPEWWKEDFGWDERKIQEHANNIWRQRTVRDVLEWR